MRKQFTAFRRHDSKGAKLLYKSSRPVNESSPNSGSSEVDTIEFFTDGVGGGLVLQADKKGEFRDGDGNLWETVQE